MSYPQSRLTGEDMEAQRSFVKGSAQARPVTILTGSFLKAQGGAFRNGDQSWVYAAWAFSAREHQIFIVAK